MKTILEPLQKSQMKTKALSACRCTKFLIGWTKRLESSIETFCVPSKNIETQNL